MTEEITFSESQKQMRLCFIYLSLRLLAVLQWLSCELAKFAHLISVQCDDI